MSFKKWVGLSEAKAVIQKALNYYKMQRLYEGKGIKRDTPAMHMVFTGDAWHSQNYRCKTVCSHYERYGLLSKGHSLKLVEAIWWESMLGGLPQPYKPNSKQLLAVSLFIDEAYSLVDEHSGSFGDEAINTIVQEMENHREDVVVIFAGYPDKMEIFLQKNPGLRSRIAFHVPFADYTADELCQIARLIGKDKGVALDDEALSKLKVIFDSAR